MMSNEDPVNKDPANERRPCRRRRRAPLADVVGSLNKFMALFDGTMTNATVLKRAFEAVFSEKDVVSVTYSSGSHNVDRVRSHEEVFQRFTEWNESMTKLQLKEIQPLAPALMEYTIDISNSNGSGTTLVCTATLRDGKIISCVEKTVVTGQPRLSIRGSITIEDLKRLQKEYEEEEKPGSLSTLSSTGSTSSSASELFKGTSLEQVEERGGAIFMNNEKDETKKTVITVVTDHNGEEQSNLELIGFHNKPTAVKLQGERPRFLLRDTACTDPLPVVFCHAASRDTYFIDGRLPLYSADKPVSPQPETKGTDFYPRFKVDYAERRVEIWNGVSYESYMDAFKEEGAKSRDIETNPSNSEWVAQVSTKGNTDLLRARIKIPAHADPSLMICLTAIEDYHRCQRRHKPHLDKQQQSKFTTLLLREVKK